MTSSSVFSDFCQAWVARFPGSELPAAWEEDVRANLKKHTSKVTALREELEKEEMYVEYLDKLLADIERQRSRNSGSNFPLAAADNGVVEGDASSVLRSSFRPDSSDSSLRRPSELDLDSARILGKREAVEAPVTPPQSAVTDLLGSTFVTVINVSGKAKDGSKALKDANKKKNPPAPPLQTFKPAVTPNSLQPSLRRKSESNNSLNSVSSPTTPLSPLSNAPTEDYLPHREGLGSKTATSSSGGEHALKLTSSEEEEEELDENSRGRPDGTEEQSDVQSQAVTSTTPNTSTTDVSNNRISKIKELMANWENKPPIAVKPKSSSRESVLAPSSKRKDSDSSSRGRMGSPSGKSHESSDSESNNYHNSQSSNGEGMNPSPGSSRRRVSGESRLDRLVRKPSSSSHNGSAPPALQPKPSVKKPKAKPRTITPSQVHDTEEPPIEEPLYDTVANDPDDLEPEDEYDNHLLYGTNSTIKSADTASSSADLGFDEPSQNSSLSLTKRLTKSSGRLSNTGTLSSSDNDMTRESPGLRRGMSVEEEQNYVNIQYFLQQRQESGSNLTGIESSPSRQMSTIHSDDESSSRKASSSETLDEFDSSAGHAVTDFEVIEAERQRKTMFRCILNSIVDSEAVYLEGLSVMLQYMKAMKVTLTTPTPVIPKEEFEVIFYKVPDLHDLHLTFLESLKKQIERSHGGQKSHEPIGHTFKMLASRTKIYAAFLNNYSRALESLHRCTEAYPQFADLTRSIKLRTVKGQKQAQSLSLEDLLHKPVARVQKHCLCLQDLVKYTPKSHPDHATLSDALSTAQAFVNEYNVMHAGELFPHQERPQRHLVRNSFIVELSEGARKLRHLFLFNDVLVCAKYKASNKKTERFTFQLKWYIPLSQALIVEEPSSEPKESSPANLVSLRTQASALRDQIHRVEKDEEWKAGGGKKGAVMLANEGGGAATPTSGGGGGRGAEKLRKKLNEVEAQLVLASPSLLFQMTHKQNGKTYSFFLSSEFERSQWVEALQVLQGNLHPSSNSNKISMDDLQAWIASCRKFLTTNMGSFLMRSARDEKLLVGDLHFRVQSIQGLTRPTDLYVVLEVDSYGHYFRKAKTATASQAMEPVWDEEFIMELEGSENLRILVYEIVPGGSGASSSGSSAGSHQLRGRATLELSRTWLSNRETEQMISMSDVVLTCTMKFVTFEETIRRVPHSKSLGLFGAPIHLSAKRERRAVPFIITSCVREVERRGITEVGIYRVSGSAVDVSKLKRAYEQNAYEAEQLLKDCDIHSVAGTLKLFLRDLQESLFTCGIYQQMFDAYREPDPELRKQTYLSLFAQIPQSPNQACIVFLIEHMVRVAQLEATNKMSLHNLATVFGPTMLHGGSEEKGKKGAGNGRDLMLATGTVDVMAQAGILHFFLSRRAKGEPIQIVERQV